MLLLMPRVWDFWSDPFIQMLDTIAGDNEVKMLTVPHLDKYVQAEWNYFKKKQTIIALRPIVVHFATIAWLLLL